MCEPKREGKEQRMTSAGRTKWPLVEMGKTVEGAARLVFHVSIFRLEWKWQIKY